MKNFHGNYNLERGEQDGEYRGTVYKNFGIPGIKNIEILRREYTIT